MVIVYCCLEETIAKFENFHMCNYSFAAVSASFFYVAPFSKLRVLKLLY